jgi:L-asparaginase
VEFDPLLDSSNISFIHWNKIAEEIESRYDQYDGFVVLHGTDTMAYSASALSFMLRGLGKPVVFTGSQIPLSELRSDGKDNLITAVMIAGQGKVCEVTLYFCGKLLRGNRATKISSDGLVAFQSPNFPALADVGIDINYRDKEILETESKPFSAHLLRKTRIGVIKVFPGIQFDLFSPLVRENLEGLILETFGSGNIPDYDEALSDLISEASVRNTVVIVCTQCLQGKVRLGAYEAGSALVSAGAVSGFDMTTEAAVAKLSYLLSSGFSREDILRLMETDLRGELTR